MRTNADIHIFQNPSKELDCQHATKMFLNIYDRLNLFCTKKGVSMKIEQL